MPPSAAIAAAALLLRIPEADVIIYASGKVPFVKRKSDHTLLLRRQKEQKNHRIFGLNMLQIMLHGAKTPLQAQKEKASNYLYSKKMP